MYLPGLLYNAHGQAGSGKGCLYSDWNILLNTTNIRESTFGVTGQSHQPHALGFLGILRISRENHATNNAAHITVKAAFG